eukprot:394903_1
MHLINSIQCDVVVYYSYASLCTIISDVYPKYACTKQSELFDYCIMFPLFIWIWYYKSIIVSFIYVYINNIIFILGYGQFFLTLTFTHCTLSTVYDLFFCVFL